MHSNYTKTTVSFSADDRHRWKCIFTEILLLILLCGQSLKSQTSRAHESLEKALRLANLYNWADAAPAFSQAEELFTQAGDRRNALYAHLGVIRATIEHNQRALPEESAALEADLAENPLLHSDKELRMFAFIVKGDIDTETNTGAMRDDWKAVEQLANELGDRKWQYRAVAQLGIAAYYDGDLETARKNVGTALQLATNAGDAASQIRFLTILANGLVQTKAYEQALAYLDNATQLASRIPDVGYQYPAEELRVQALIGLKQLDNAQRANDELRRRAHDFQRGDHEATALALAAQIAVARNDPATALANLQQAIAVGEAQGLTRLLAEVYGNAAEIYRRAGNLESAQRFAESAANASQESGDFWGVPKRLMALAELQVSRGQYADADVSYERAEAFIDSVIGQSSTALEKTAIIRASSEIFTRHVALTARLDDPEKAYAVIEHVRGRVAADLLAAGSVAQPASGTIERTISRLRLKLMGARSMEEVRKLRDQIFIAEQAKWITPGASILMTKSDEAIPIATLRTAIPPNAVLLEYVVAEPDSYCLVITSTGLRIIRLEGKSRIDALVAAHLRAVKSKQSAISEARSLYDALIGSLGDVWKKDLFIIAEPHNHSGRAIEPRAV